MGIWLAQLEEHATQSHEFEPHIGCGVYLKKKKKLLKILELDYIPFSKFHCCAWSFYWFQNEELSIIFEFFKQALRHL